MRPHGPKLTHPWMLAAAAVVLIAGHGFLYYAFSNRTLPAVVISGAIILVAIKHLGVLRFLYVRLRRRSWL